MPRPNAALPFDDLSEASGIPISQEGAEMMATRYGFAADLCAGRPTLELACASGPGLGWLRQSSPFVVGLDINWKMLARGHAHYGDRIPLLQGSAEELPFEDGSFGCVLLLEATYYLPNVQNAVREIARILAPGGTLLFVNANPERPDFIRSPHSHHYHSAEEFRALLEAEGFSVETRAAFPLDEEKAGTVASIKRGVLRLARVVFGKAGLIPRTLSGRAKLKRLLGRKLLNMPAEIAPTFAPRSEIGRPFTGRMREFMVIYVTAVKPSLAK